MNEMELMQAIAATDKRVTDLHRLIDELGRMIGDCIVRITLHQDEIKTTQAEHTRLRTEYVRLKSDTTNA